MVSFVEFSLLGRGPIDILLGITACVPSGDFLVVAATCRPFAFACASDLLGRSCGRVVLALDEASLHLEALARNEQVPSNVLLIVPPSCRDFGCACFIALAKLVRLSHKEMVGGRAFRPLLFAHGSGSFQQRREGAYARTSNQLIPT